MNRNNLFDRLLTWNTRRPRVARLRDAATMLEPLEHRCLLSVNELLISTFDDTGGASVLRLNENTHQRVFGGVETGDNGLGQAQGIVTAPDGTYYVSSLAIASVLHYSRAGDFLGYLGQNDPMGHHVMFAGPGSLAFGPNGNLYVADIFGGAVYQFDVTSETQQFQEDETLSLGYFPSAIAFRGNDLLVGALLNQSVISYAPDNAPTVLIAAGSGINPSAILPIGGNDLLITDIDIGGDPLNHHRIVKFDPDVMMPITTFINFTNPVGTGAAAGNPAQPTQMIFDHDGNLLIGLSPDHNGNGAVVKHNVTTGALMDTIITSIGTPSGLAFIAPAPTDLLTSTFDSTNSDNPFGDSVLRYNEVSKTRIAGGVATLDNGIALAQGVAVAPDRTYYVSSFATGQVYHYSNTGAFLGFLGENDALGDDPTTVTFVTPGSMAFGPNGHLYVADIFGQAVYEFDTQSEDQQYLAAETLLLPYQPSAIAFTFGPDARLVVGALTAQSVISYDDAGTPTTLVAGGSGINPSTILPKLNGDLYIGDFDNGGEPLGHHQIVLYNHVTHALTPFIDLNEPVGTGAAEGNPAQPTAMLYDHDGNLLIGVSPDHNQNGAILKYNAQSGAAMGTFAGGIGTPSGLAFIPSVGATSEKKQLFYNHSKFDGNNAAITPADDNAIAADKVPYVAFSGPSTFANVSSYSRGINGITVDISGPHGQLTADDFSFKFNPGNTAAANSPELWAAAPAPSDIVVLGGAGVGGSDRVYITWADGAMLKGWLEVTVKGNDDVGGDNTNTGLAASDVFYWGNAVGDTGTGDTATRALVNATDELAIRGHQLLAGATVTNIYDIDRSGSVNATDQLLVRNNGTIAANAVRYIDIGAEILAPEADGGDDGAVATALATTSQTAAAGSAPSLKSWVAALEDRLPATRPAGHVVATIFDKLGDALKSKGNASHTVHEVADELLDLLAAVAHHGKK